MSTISTSIFAGRNTLLRPILTAGTVIFLGQALHMWIVQGLIQKTPMILAWQYIASGGIGMPAFEGGIATALVGVAFHLLISFSIAAVFVLAAGRLSWLRHNPMVGSLLYGFGVFVVMNMIIVPLSATPPIPAPELPWLIEAILEHILLIGLSLGIILRRSAAIEK